MYGEFRAEIETISSAKQRQQRQEVAQKGTDAITDGGKLSYVLMTYDEFQRLTAECRSLVEALSMPGLSGVDFDLTRWDARIGWGRDMMIVHRIGVRPLAKKSRAS